MPEGLTSGAVSPAHVAIRSLLFLGLLIAIGAIAFEGAVLGFPHRKRSGDSLPTTRARHGAARAGLMSIALVGVAAMLRLIAQSYAMHGPADTFNAPLVGAMLRSTVWGWGWLLQIAAVIVAAAGFRSALARRLVGGARWRRGARLHARTIWPRRVRAATHGTRHAGR